MAEPRSCATGLGSGAPSTVQTESQPSQFGGEEASVYDTQENIARGRLGGVGDPDPYVFQIDDSFRTTNSSERPHDHIQHSCLRSPFRVHSHLSGTFNPCLPPPLVSLFGFRPYTDTGPTPALLLPSCHCVFELSTTWISSVGNGIYYLLAEWYSSD